MRYRQHISQVRAQAVRPTVKCRLREQRNNAHPDRARLRNAHDDARVGVRAATVVANKTTARIKLRLFLVVIITDEAGAETAPASIAPNSTL